jgi:serum/glucocorticoid-regulated kinase 2
MAPEMLLKIGHNYMVDCYCLGALLYELVTGKLNSSFIRLTIKGLPPFYSQDTQKIYRSILNDQIRFPTSLNVSDEVKQLIEQLLEKDPSNRIGA